VLLDVEGVTLHDTGALVVYLDLPSGASPRPVPSAVSKIRQRNATFTPSLLVVTAGQSIELANDDTIFHNVFSYSAPNDFDLGLYPKGESRRVRLQHPGVVRLYCSIHETMNATVFVAPSVHHAIASDSGDFELRDVPPGRYRLRTWSERLPAASLAVEVGAGQSSAVALRISLNEQGGAE
jgi:plastocyanin